MPVLASETPRKIGRRYFGVRDINGFVLPEQAIVVIREATFAEWRDDVGAERADVEVSIFPSLKTTCRFYEVLTD